MSLLDDPAHWRTRASDIQRLADASADPPYRAKLQKIAASYDLLAVRAGESRPRPGHIASLALSDWRPL
jgi:hypothetical protein